MPHRPTIFERAYELARSGKHAKVDTIRRQLVAEHFEGVSQHISGSAVKTLQKLMVEAGATPGSPGIRMPLRR